MSASDSESKIVCVCAEIRERGRERVNPRVRIKREGKKRGES